MHFRAFSRSVPAPATVVVGMKPFHPIPDIALATLQAQMDALKKRKSLEKKIATVLHEIHLLQVESIAVLKDRLKMYAKFIASLEIAKPGQLASGKTNPGHTITHKHSGGEAGGHARMDPIRESSSASDITMLNARS